jgi:predicted amidohydrolase YtcJ
MRPHLYPVGALERAGVRLAFGSDAPVSDPNPMPALHAAVTRLTARGRPLGPEQAMDLAHALAAYTGGSAASSCLEDSLGKIAPGMLADLALFEDDVASAEPERIRDMSPEMTFLGGKPVWES